MKRKTKKIKHLFYADGGSRQVELLVSPLAEKILKCIADYSGIAETGNIEYDLELMPSTRANALRTIIKAGFIKCFKGGGTMWNYKQYGGSIYKLVGKSG